MRILLSNFFKRLVVFISCIGSIACTEAISAVELVMAPQVSKSEANLPFEKLPDLKKPFVDLSPKQQPDGILVGEFNKSGANSAKLIEFAEALSTKGLGRYDSVLIAHQGKLIFESYYRRGRVDLPHWQASTTKAYLSLAVGRAIQLGYLSMADLNRPVASFLNKLDPTKFVDGASTITLHQAMTMRSGLRINAKQKEALKNRQDKMTGQNQVQALFEVTAPISAQQQVFHYQSEDPILVMQVLNAVVPGGARSFIEVELFNKLGIKNFKWRDDVSGLPMGPFGSQLLSRDMLKLGLLASRNGEWQGEQVISKAFIKWSTQRIIAHKDSDIFFTGDTVVNAGYGYYWWQADMKVGDTYYSTRSAQGGGGQYIVLIDELDLIVVTTAHERNDETMKLVSEKILPLFLI
ncbi:serine hydrolase domain-containing protein [Pseudoalteromonas luteoviolacea]|uniref:serine hydrolase domain-containing protein n=1 Tax=Pseudoalteromonas luteoviolacea TaxID=43657 RepID=UPI00114EB27A|nr:serine hydrolase [Pseudoalteromonas luteoviolacea]TQF72950.1 serine hydrolase [Pseudoalteromonas luteoviolacea]